MSTEQFLAVAGVALGAGGLAAAIIGIGGRWPRVLLVIVGTCALAFAGAAVIVIMKDREHMQHVDAVSRKIVSAIGSGRKTSDEILESLFPEDFGTVSESLSGLLAHETVGANVAETVDRAGIAHKVRVYFVKQ